MCGIAGFINLGPQSNLQQDCLRSIAGGMADAMKSRGPNDQGTWVDAAVGIGFGFRRLAIVDLSPAGHQPMVSANGRFVIVFNGEIYNHIELRKELQPLRRIPTASTDNPQSIVENVSDFRGRSDTEVLLAGIEAWGFESTLRRTVGMFAIALWDRRDRVLHLARDRMGEKPLYYGIVGRTFLFGSELKALRAHPDFEAPIDRDALQLYMRHGCIAAPHTIYQGISKLLPGSTLTVASDGSCRELQMPRPYWSVRETAVAGQIQPLRLSDSEATAQLECLLIDSISGQMMADVPVGAFLSGGVDSSTVVALMQSLHGSPIKTFSIGFNESGYDEAKYARLVARHLKTDHTELYVSAEQAQSVIPQLPRIYDEPFADSSQIPTFLVAQLAKTRVTVSLSGDGGDELFEGYSRYAYAKRLWRLMRILPGPLRNCVASTIGSHACARVVGSASFPTAILERFGIPPRLDSKLSRLNEVLRHDDVQQLYRGMMSHWTKSDAIVQGANEAYSALNDPNVIAEIPDFGRKMRLLDQIAYLPDDILTKVDRAAMSVSLESRIPLLDHRIVEFAWRLPKRLLCRDGKSKWILRQVLYKYVPPSLIDRPKMGFGIPVGMWLRGPLRNWAEGLLAESKLRNEGFLNVGLVRQRWNEHVKGDRDWQHHLWAVLMFQAWLENSAADAEMLKCAA